MAAHDTREGTGVAPRALRLAGGDALVIALFLLAGELSHGVDPLAHPFAVLETFAPFLIGWFVVAPIFYAYDRSALATPRRAGRLAAGAWLGAANVGLILRGAPYFSGGTTWPFPLVITGVGLVSLVAWRVAASVFLAPR